ncbi:MAG: gamma carbonic anhydrase family protein [Planctomycetota bacterium]|jgi:carbonic anhydrase/acetyltransferase-like protein (isoleucine patch superfamily)
MPTMHKVGNVYIAQSAVVEGDVELGDQTNIWHHCVLRGDVGPIRTGRRVNIQDGSILHCDKDVPLEIADEVVIGHNTVVHCRSVGSRTLIGNSASVLDHCEIGQDCIIAAGAVVPPDTVIPDGSVVMGVPGKIVRQISEKERQYIRYVNQAYVELAQQYAEGQYPAYAEKVMQNPDN